MVPVLSKAIARDAGKRLQCVALTKEDAQFRRTSSADHDRCWRGKAHGAGASDDQHGDHLDQRIAQSGRGPEPKPEHEGQGRDRDHSRDEPCRHFVDQRLDRQFRALRLLHHADDLRQRRIGAGLGDLEGKAASRVDRSADHIGADALGHRNWLAGQHRFIDKGGAFDHLPVDRYFFAGLDQNNVADQRHRREAISTAAPSRSTHARLGLEADQTLDRRAGAALGARFKARVQARSESRSRRRIRNKHAMFRPGTATGREGDERRIGEGRAGAERNKRIHIGGAAPKRRKSAPEETQAGTEQNKSGQREFDDPARLHPDCRS